MCVTGESDHVAHGHNVPPPVSPRPAADSSSRKVVVTMMEAGNPLCLTHITGCQQRPRGGVERVVVALSSGFRQSVSLSASLANSSGRCSPPSRANCASAFCRVFDVNEVGQPVTKTANHRDVAVADRSGALRLGGGRQPWRQRFTGDRMARPKILRIADAPTGLGAADPQPIGQCMGQLAAQFGLAGLPGELVDQCVAGRRQPAGVLFEALQHGQDFRASQHVERQLEQSRYRVVESVETLDDFLTVIRMHVRRISPLADSPVSLAASMWMNLQLWITAKSRYVTQGARRTSPGRDHTSAERRSAEKDSGRSSATPAGWPRGNSHSRQPNTVAPPGAPC
jgi:hypothetical protein